MSAPATEGSAPGNRRLQQTQAQVDEVVDIMRVNVDKVLERDSKLSELDDRADALQAGASQFETSAAKLKRKFWWKNCKSGASRRKEAVVRGGRGMGEGWRGASKELNVSNTRCHGLAY
uniref:Vesicle-associated membrane protein 3-like n=1 Tax=Salmo trutta TaxID=8032 RepID=A0A674ET41_SALTR